MGINTFHFSINGNCLDEPWDLLNIMLVHETLVSSYDTVEAAMRNSYVCKFALLLFIHSFLFYPVH
jgi:hypothetical protein